MVELLRRYSNRPDLLKPLVRVMEKINNPTHESNEKVTNTYGRTASPNYTRKILTNQEIQDIITTYAAGTTAKVLAERYDVHITTIKKKLARCGVRRKGS